MYKNERAIANVIGKVPTFMRPPMLKCGKDCEKDMKDLGYHVVHWQYDSGDWRDPLKSVEEMADNNLIPTMDKIDSQGSMFTIQHDINNNAAKVADALLTHMHDSKRGWEAVPLVECLGHDLDDAYRFPKYLEYNGAAKGGCLISGPNMCVQPIAFQSKNGCWDAKKAIDAE